MPALTTSGKIDGVAQFTADGASKVSGIIDVNNTGASLLDNRFPETFTVAASGRTTMALQTPLGTQNLVVYVVNGSRALFVELDSGIVAAGDIRHQ